MPSYNYDNNYDPAMPVMTIGLSPSGEDISQQELTALIDSGADGTMLPVDILTAVNARYVGQYKMRGVVGEAITIHRYLIAVHVGEYTIHGIRAVAVPQGREAIVGRDVLNQLTVVLNGLAHIVDIH